MDYVKEGTPSNEVLEELAVEIGDSWKKLGRRLKFEEAALFGFHERHEESSEKAYHMLLTWKRNHGPMALYQVIYDALCHHLVGRTDLASKFCCDEAFSLEDFSEKELGSKGKGKRSSSSTDVDQTLKRLRLMTGTEKAILVFHYLQKPRVDANQNSKEVDLLKDLRQNARSDGFIISNNPGGGNCMFYALAEQLRQVKGISISHGELRRRLVAFLQSNPRLASGTDLYSFVAGYSSWSDYLEDMGKDRTWGDHVVLVATANCFQVPIRIISSLPDRPNIAIEPESPVDITNPLVLGHVHELHYVSLLPVQEAQTGSEYLVSPARTLRPPFYELGKLLSCIKDEYIRRARLQPVLWCDVLLSFEGVYTRLAVKVIKMHSPVLTDQKVEMYDIFFSHDNCKNPRSVLVEGDPGIGKSTFCLKMANDWATGAIPTDCSFPQVELVLLLKCRDIDGDVWKAFEEQLFPKDVEDQETSDFLKYIQLNQEKLLIILDGLDELPEHARQDVSNVILRKVIPNCFLVITARQERGIHVRKEFDTVLEIKGFAKSDAFDYISRYFQDKGEESLGSDLIEEIKLDRGDCLSNFLENPLNTTLLCLVFEDQGKLPSTRTELYWSIIFCILKRFCTKNSIPFDDSTLIEQFKDTLVSFGKLALDCLKEDRLYFSEKKLNSSTQQVPQMGFVSKEAGTKMIKPEHYYAFPHKTFQEFFSALYVADMTIRDAKDMHDFISSEDDINVKYREVFVFVAEILGKKPSDYFEILRQLYKERGSVPDSILARGEKGMAAYRRAVKSGSTLDKRVKVLLVGQDRVGKTSVGRTLKGEKFNENEPSTEGVLMNKPLKNVGQQAWQNSELHKDISVYDHKCAEYVSRDLTRSPDHSVKGPTEESTTEPTGKPNSEQNKQATQELHVPNTPAEERSKDPIKKDPPINTETGTAENTFNTPQHVPEQEEIVMPEDVARLVENNLQEEKTDSGEGIWPVIWDFAGQAVYRAIHPIFLSPDIVYILVFDLRKKLSAKARCCVKRDGRDEKEIQSCDYNDTNLDHIMRWMDLVHSFKTVPKGLPHVAWPPVIIVGTHADSEDVNHNEKMDILMEKFCNTEEFEKHIVDTFVVDNTRAGQPKDQEDPAAKDLRDLILREASKMPYTKHKVPFQWLAVEKKISETASQGLKYITRKEFKEKITNGICSFKDENDIEVLLHVLHDRGSILYHDRADNSDGLVVLDPQWLIKVLCEILKVEPEDGERPAIKRYRKNLETEGILAKELLEHACTKLGLVGIKGYLLHLMEKYNLLCSFKSKDEKEAYLVPCMVTARPDKQTTCTSSKYLPPLFLTFKTNYVPCGLFPRLVLLFADWAKLKCRSQPRLWANAAIFYVGKVHCLGFSCYKSVIKFFIWTQDDSDPLEKDPQCCLEVLGILEKSLDKLCKECHWLHSCSWALCVQCNRCPESPDTMSVDCYWHDKKNCLQEDCAHYVGIPLNHEPLYCDILEPGLDDNRDTRLRGREKFEPWIQAFTKLRDTKDQEKPATRKRSSTRNGIQTPKRRKLATMPRQVKEGEPSSDELQGLAAKIGDYWEKLGRRLDFDDAAIEGFDNATKLLSDKAYKMLSAWKKRDGPDATYQKLYVALCHHLVGRRDLGTKFCCV